MLRNWCPGRVLSAGDWWRTTRAAAVAAFSAVALLFSAAASAALSDCIELGGQAVCTAPQVGPWGYGLCDEAGPSAARLRAWCLATGGTYLGVYAGGCQGGTPNTESNLYPRALAFSNILHAPNACSGTDTGWGQTISSYLCWSGGPTYQNGTLVRDFRTMNFSCGETIRAGRWRTLICPVGTQQRTVGSQTVCVRTIDAACPVGNPVLPATGLKVQTEHDLEFEGVLFQRHYSAAGSIYQFASGTGAVSIDSLWRHTFDVRLQAIAMSDYTTASVSWPDGRIQYFKSNGAAILPTQDNATRLQPSGSGHILWSSGYAYRFTAQGSLAGLTSAAGQTFSLRYADGTLGPNGQAAVDSTGVPMPSPVPAGHLIEVASSFGRTLRLDRDVAGRLTQLWAPGSAVPTRYGYGSDEHLARVSYPDLSTRDYAYNEVAATGGANLPDALTGVLVSGSGAGTARFATFRYNAAGQAVSTEHAGGVNRHTLSFLIPGEATVVQEPLGSARTHYFTKIAGVIRSSGQSQPGGSGCSASTSAQTYDANGNVASRDDFNGHRVCYASDLSRNLETSRVEGLVGGAPGTACTSVTAPGAALPASTRKTSTQWHPDWNLQTRLAEPGRVTTFVYNGQPNPFAGGALAGCAPASAFLPDGKPIAVLCRQVEQATGDADGSLGFSAPLQSGVPAREQRWTYNEVGQVLTHDGPRTDVADITVNEYYPDTAFTGNDPNAIGRTRGDLKQTTSPAGHVTRYTLYDKLGQVLEMVDPNGVITRHTYDPRQRLTSTTVAGQITVFDYWTTGLLKRTTLPDQSWVHRDYDDAHRLIRVSDNLGNSISYTLDNMGNRTAEDVRDPGNALRRQLTRSIDALGRVQQITGRE